MFTLLHRHDVTALTAVSNTVIEIEIFCHQTSKVNNFVSK